MGLGEGLWTPGEQGMDWGEVKGRPGMDSQGLEIRALAPHPRACSEVGARCGGTSVHVAHSRLKPSSRPPRFNGSLISKALS